MSRRKHPVIHFNRRPSIEPCFTPLWVSLLLHLVYTLRTIPLLFLMGRILLHGKIHKKKTQKKEKENNKKINHVQLHKINNLVYDVRNSVDTST